MTPWFWPLATVAVIFAICTVIEAVLFFRAWRGDPAVVCDDPAEAAGVENPLAAGDEYRAHLADIDTQVADFRTDIEAFERGRWVR